MQISQQQTLFSYNSNSNRQNLKNTTKSPMPLKSDTLTFGNQTTRGVTSKMVDDLAATLEDGFRIPPSLKTKLRRAHSKYKDIENTRWKVGNKRYQGRDRERYFDA